MKVGIIVFPGSNCDRDMFHVLTDVFQFDTSFYWHENKLPKDIEAVILPGGFSYGDRLRAGVIAAHSPIITTLRQLDKKGIPILGVCNGFQILVEAGLLPGVLMKNTSLNFMCKWTSLIVENNQTPFTNKLKLHQEIPIPIANGEGRYYVDENTLGELKKENQIVFRYKENVNGSSYNIAGVCNKQRNIVGMMPHPERAAEKSINPIDNRPASLIFESLINTLEVKI
ncbi:MAG: phosphoribosylformylglycinamidine synthase subunit PurQ [Nitrosopumilaceae archaeon]|nr:phosphoribosylformylglycinamidine synthase subunit PurQ [Nitrosopumilaceae archaeon]NIU02502.1 phosphoribosylformylglycinamidine synthase subunit PurQ [Nitrosopumilaceae archaeon]NIU88963.1 phosphoribosylformylglycinamidine synthase subunit PurQ [Nitrosopumilaceae archaeon]NIV67074.1 phosphoribosylformylglycinamidine synthase subunit PurQ [Nitrosopumilaceae archaeon]NIX63103.1 phosphoribosylformylglycinamidine synthase subunit PurQ [Nitrosopumilaceae archaeon]